MVAVAFDTLKAYNKLVDAGVPAQQAKAYVELLVEILPFTHASVTPLPVPSPAPASETVAAPTEVTLAADGETTSALVADFTCCPLQAGVKSFPVKDTVPTEVYANGMLEHPAIAGLMLNPKQRVYSAMLEYTDKDGAIFTETLRQKQFRAMWKKPVPSTRSSTEGNFQTMNHELFRKQ